MEAAMAPECVVKQESRTDMARTQSLLRRLSTAAFVTSLLPITALGILQRTLPDVASHIERPAVIVMSVALAVCCIAATAVSLLEMRDMDPLNGQGDETRHKTT